MAYDDMIERADADALIPEEASREILQHVAEGSSFLSLARRLQDMATGTRRLPVMSALPLAYFVDEAPGESDETLGNTSYKQTTKAEWEKKYVYAEEIACIVPIPESVLDDAGYDIWGEIRPHIVEAIGAVVDGAVYYGTGAPASWPDGIVPDAIAALNYLALGDVGDLYDDIMGGDETTPGLIMHVELDGYFPNGYVGAVSMRGRLRGLRSGALGDGAPLFRQALVGMPPATQYELDGQRIFFPLNGVVDPDESLLICGDWTKAVYAIRKDITYKLLTEAVITDPTTGAIVYNLAQQDMVALRVTFRMGWQIANPINRMNSDADTRFPFSVLLGESPSV
jgi:HK97 family phage major capsid protein